MSTVTWAPGRGGPTEGRPRGVCLEPRLCSRPHALQLCPAPCPRGSPSVWGSRERAHTWSGRAEAETRSKPRESLPRPTVIWFCVNGTRKARTQAATSHPHPGEGMRHFLSAPPPLHLGTLSRPSARGGQSEDTAAQKEPTRGDQGAGWPESVGRRHHWPRAQRGGSRSPREVDRPYLGSWQAACWAGPWWFCLPGTRALKGRARSVPLSLKTCVTRAAAGRRWEAALASASPLCRGGGGEGAGPVGGRADSCSPLWLPVSLPRLCLPLPSWHVTPSATAPKKRLAPASSSHGCRGHRALPPVLAMWPRGAWLLWPAPGLHRA